MKEIKSISDIISLLKSNEKNWKNFGNVKVTTKGNLSLFNYTAKAQYEGTWNYFETVSRGLIINNITGEIIARPFDKFFNWGEGRNKLSPISNVIEKMDGSLGIAYFDESMNIATRGSFDSEQALWATSFLKIKHPNIHNLPSTYPLTLLFEIIYPTNRIIVDYSNTESLVLLAARNRFDGTYLDVKDLKLLANYFNLDLPKFYSCRDLESILKDATKIDSMKEGWVVEFSNGGRCKVKGDAYTSLAKKVNGLSFKNTLRAVEEGKVDELLGCVADEFLGDVRKWLKGIEDTRLSLVTEIENIFEICPKETRKDFALYVTQNYKKWAGYLFAKFDGKDIDEIIYKKAFNKERIK